MSSTPTVALESTIVAHGLPWPDNLAIARELEATVRERGATPATIAVVDGAIKVGLTAAELERLARDGKSFAKAGAADLAVHVARGGCAATTVSATATIAARAGIRVFATGGIGGVHRGGSVSSDSGGSARRGVSSDSRGSSGSGVSSSRAASSSDVPSSDVSHDLYALARTPICVVSAGAKAILDLPRTLELLETLGVLVIGYQTSEFPAFYTRESGLRLDHRVEDARELAAIARAHWELGGGGILVANPIPAEAALDRATIDAAIERALADAEAAAITGKALTPYLLARLAEVTGGASIHANRALALHDAAVAAELAVALA